MEDGNRLDRSKRLNLDEWNRSKSSGYSPDMRTSRFWRNSFSGLALCGIAAALSFGPDAAGLQRPFWPLAGLQQPVGSNGAVPPSSPGKTAQTGEHAKSVRRTESYIVEMMGQPAGTSTTVESEQDGKVITQTDMKFALRRGTVEIKISIQTEFVETADGKPVSMKVNQMLASMPKEEVYLFGDKEVTITTTSMGKPMTSTKPLPGGEWLTPANAAKTAREMAKRGEKEITFSTIDPSNGLNIVKMERTRGDKESITAGTAQKECWRWNTKVIMPGMPAIQSTEYVDDAGDLWRSKTNLGGIAMDLVRANAAEASQTFRGPEMMVDLFVRPDRPINDPRHSKMLTYTLSVKEGELPTLPSDAGQTFARLNDRSATVSVNAVMSAAAQGVDDPATVAPFLASSTMIDASDSKVAELAAAAVKDVPSNQIGARAEALRKAVYQHINKKALDVGFGSASETARSGVGDCSEHGVLLAAMLRNQKIPARVVAGLIYADQFAGERGIFGYHMWTQALIEKNGAKRWIDLDATLPPGTPTDATHIAVSVSALGDGEMQTSMMNLVPLLGRLEIKVHNATARPAVKEPAKEQPQKEPAGAR